MHQLLGQSTSYVERTHLTSRHMNGRLVRKTLGYSKELEMLRASSFHLGRYDLQPGTGVKDFEDREWKGSREALDP